ncbi:MAG: tetratricopeptide repeat protein [Chloroflexi bacterium]|nr:tetratricopeptide repeat protein [Chloroflexota bacterium]
MDLDQTTANELIKLANAFHREEKYEQAIATYRQAIALIPNSPVYTAYHFMIGDMLAEMQRYEEAVQAFRETVKAIPMHDEAWFRLGESLMLLGCDEKAAQAFDRCLAIDDRVDRAWYYGATVYARLNDGNRAAKYLERALQLGPEWELRAQQDPLLNGYLQQ